MKPGEIIQVVARYLLGADKPREELVGCLGAPRFFQANQAELERSGISETVFGRAEDVVADLLERNKFFGGYVESSPDQANNCNNGGIYPIRFDGREGRTDISGIFRAVQGKPGCLMVEVPQISEKPYLTLLRTPESFILYAATLDVPSHAERVGNLFEKH